MRRYQQAPGLRLVLCVLVTGISACGMNPEQKRAVRTWLECGDCGEEALAAVDTLADFSVESELIRAMQGPRGSMRARVARHLRASYRMAMRQLGVIPTPDAEEAYVRNRLAGFVAGYQRRAVVALGRISTFRARRALRWSLLFESKYAPHVATEIRTQLADSIVPVTVTLDTVGIAENVPELPTVRVYRGSSPWAGAAVTFVTNGMGRIQGSYCITDSAGLASVTAWYADSAPGMNIIFATVPRDTARFSVLGQN